MDFASFTIGDYWHAVVLFIIFIIVYYLTFIILNFGIFLFQKAFLYRKARKVLSGYSDSDIKLFIDYVVDGVSHSEGKHD